MQTIRQRHIVSIREMIQHVSELATRSSSFRFTAVTQGYTTRTEVATAFLAVLVLIRGRSLDASQDGLFNEIELSGVASVSTDDSLEDVDDAFIN
jgi:chromatin segregation and condensation protein Rec8/ScpA/Scc1 (kleisin family)